MQRLLLAGLELGQLIDGLACRVDFRRGLDPDRLQFGFDATEFLVEARAFRIGVDEKPAPIACLRGLLGEPGVVGGEAASATLEFARARFDLVVHAVAEPVALADFRFERVDFVTDRGRVGARTFLAGDEFRHGFAIV